MAIELNIWVALELYKIGNINYNLISDLSPFLETTRISYIRYCVEFEKFLMGKLPHLATPLIGLVELTIITNVILAFLPN